MRSYWLFAALVLSLLVAFLQQWALAEYLYWKYEWFDLLMHVVGGLAIGSFLVGFLIAYKPRTYAILFALIVIAWEVLEYCFGTPRQSNYAFDTALDLVMGAVGSIIAFLIARRTVWQRGS